MSQPPRFVYLHGNCTTHWSSAWAPWLKSELEERGFGTFFETLPDSVIARAEYWLPFLRDHVQAGENDILIGWSSGAVAAMRYAESARLLGSILVAPCYTDLGDDLEKQSGYFDEPWQWEAIRTNQQRLALMWSDDDPYIPQQEFRVIAEQLRPAEFKLAARKHFIEQDTFPELLRYIDETYS